MQSVVESRVFVASNRTEVVDTVLSNPSMQLCCSNSETFL